MKHIPLTLGLTAVVDDIDYDRCMRHAWRPLGGTFTWYARTGDGILLHRFILGDPPFDGAQVDHVNHHGWDNTRENLRWVTHATNERNKREERDQYPPFIGIRRVNGSWQYWSSLSHTWHGSYRDCLSPAVMHDREAIAAGSMQINFPALLGDQPQGYSRTYARLGEEL